MSQEDLKLWTGGHYQFPLSFRNDEVNLPNNHSQAKRSFLRLRENCEEILNSNKVT